MTVSDIVKQLEQLAPPAYAQGWDNPGLLVGRKDAEVDCVYVALDATEDVIQAAIDCGAQLIITHHPMIFSPLKKVNDDDFISKRVLTLIENRISLYAMHTNYDVSRMADLSAACLKLKDVTVLDETVAVGEFGNDNPLGIGCVGLLEQPMTLKECANFVKDAFDVATVKLFGEPTQMISRVGVCPGSGKHMADIAIAKNCDVLITGDIDHHEGIDANSKGLMIIDAGHYGIEHIFIDDVATFVQQAFNELCVEKAKHKNPFWVI